MTDDSAAPRTILLPIAVTIAGILVWAALSYLRVFPESAFPSPLSVARGFVEEVETGRLLTDLVASLFRVTTGFALAVALGLPLGLVLGHRSRARAALLPAVNFFRNLSPLAWIPFAILWFGIGDIPSIFLIFMASFFPVVIATIAAVASIPSVYFRVAKDYHFSSFELWTHVTLPAIAPQVITALRVTAGLAWVVVVAAEMIAGRDGLGFAIWDARNGLRMDLLVAGMIVIGVIGVMIDRLLVQLTRSRAFDGVMNDKPLRLQGVNRSFGSVEVLSDLSLDISRGEFLAVVGPSGCGKTTLLNLCSGFDAPSSGTVTRSGRMRMVYQQDGLFPWQTVRENISLGFRHVENEAERKQQMNEMVSLIRLEGFENHYPHQLSGGMRQRVELARALAGESDILLLDEPFSSLDYLTRLRMRRELAEMLRERPRTVVLVTHDIEEAAQLADRVVVLTERPARISCELTLRVARPRDLTHPEVVDAVHRILTELGLGGDMPKAGGRGQERELSKFAPSDI